MAFEFRLQFLVQRNQARFDLVQPSGQFPDAGAGIRNARDQVAGHCLAASLELCRLLHRIGKSTTALLKQGFDRVALGKHCFTSTRNRPTHVVFGGIGGQEKPIPLDLDSRFFGLFALTRLFSPQDFEFFGRLDPFGNTPVACQSVMRLAGLLGRQSLAVMHVAVLVDPFVDVLGKGRICQ